MKRITIAASRTYDVLIGAGLLQEAGKWIAELPGVQSVMLVSDDNVFPLYGEALCRVLTARGFRVCRFVFPHGERNKNLRTYGQLLEELAAARFSRSDLIVTLGGGVVGDLAGFAAATYQRGIRFMQIPTTLLAAVDASVGGKTAVDLENGKNQAGCFHQPSLVLCDPDVFATLPEEEYRCGCAEVIKYAMIGNETFFHELMEKPVSEQTEHVISTCVQMKRDFVLEDEYDTGSRMKLNFGHTIGHAVEACSDFSVLHGQAVAMGMAAITKSACHYGICSERTLQALQDILQKYGLLAEIRFPLAEMERAALLDKKIAGGQVRLVLPEGIGKCRIETIGKEDLREWLIHGGVQ